MKQWSIQVQPTSRIFSDDDIVPYIDMCNEIKQSWSWVLIKYALGLWME